MLGNYLIGLREGLEAALVVVILLAYLVRTDRRSLIPGIWGGAGLAVAISLAFGAVLTFGPRGLTFEAQEIIGGVLSLVAVGLVTWMIFWMAGHARQLSGQLKGSVDQHATSGRGGMVLVALLAVGREGLETALFLWAATRAAAGTSAGGWMPLVGAALGLVTAVLIAWLIYRGAVRLDLGKFFTWTGAFLILVAAGVLAYAFHDLQEGGLVPGLDTVAWDISHLIAPTSILGSVLKGVFNFTPAPTVVEAVAWIAYVGVVMPLYFLRLRRSTTRTGNTAPTGARTATDTTTTSDNAPATSATDPEGAHA